MFNLLSYNHGYALYKNAHYLSVNVFSMNVLIKMGTFFVSNWELDCHFMWLSKPLLEVYAKGVPSCLSYFKTLSTCPALGIQPLTSCSAVKCYTD